LRSQRDFSSPETQTLMAHPERRIWQSLSPVQKVKVRFMWPQRSRSVDGTIRDSFSKSQTPINESIFLDRRRQHIRNNKGAKLIARFNSGTAHVRFMQCRSQRNR